MMSFCYKTGNGLTLFSNYPWASWSSAEKVYKDAESISIEVINDPLQDLKGWNKIDVLEDGGRIVWENQDAGVLTAINGEKLELRYSGEAPDGKCESWVKSWGIATILFQRGFLVIPGCQVQTINGPILCLGKEYPDFVASDKGEASSPFLNEFIAVRFDPHGGFSVYDISAQGHSVQSDNYFPDISTSKALSEFESFKRLFEQGPVQIRHLSENLIIRHFRNIEQFLNMRRMYKIDIYGTKIFFTFLNTDPRGLV